MMFESGDPFTEILFLLLLAVSGLVYSNVYLKVWRKLSGMSALGTYFGWVIGFICGAPIFILLFGIGYFLLGAFGLW